MALLTNMEIWDDLRGRYPNFRNQTSKATRELFSARGYEQLEKYDNSILNEFFQLSMKVYLQKINVAKVKDLLEEQGFGESYDKPYGGYTQRMAISSIKPISVVYPKNGDSPDPFVYRQNEASERFWIYNDDYASLISMPDSAMYKSIFTAEYGMAEFQAGMMQALNNGRKLHRYNTKIEAINQILNSTDHALKDSQKFGVDITSMDASQVTTADAAVAFASQFVGLIQTINNIVDAMVYTPATGAYNVAGFETTQDIKRLKMLVRPDLYNAIKTIQRWNTPIDMQIPVDIVKLPDFGGLKPFRDANFTQPAYEVYDTLGSMIGYATTENAQTPDIDEADLFWKDPNKDIVAIIADKGIIFTETTNPYTVEPIRNPRPAPYTNYWARALNNGVHVDTYYNIVTISNTH